MSAKGNFFILFRSSVINKNAKNKCGETRSFLIFANNSRSKQNIKNFKHTFKGSGKKETNVCEVSAKMLNSMDDRACQNFQFFR